MFAFFLIPKIMVQNELFVHRTAYTCLFHIVSAMANVDLAIQEHM